MRIEPGSVILQKLQLLILCILTLNVADGILTIILVGTGRAVEANPLMAYLIGHNPVLFMFCKQALVSLGILLLWRLRHYVLAVVSIFAVFLLYYLNLLHQITFFTLRSV